MITIYPFQDTRNVEREDVEYEDPKILINNIMELEEQISGELKNLREFLE